MKSVIAVVNQKGGVGKTTTTANLAYALSQRGKSVLAIDLDPQASLTIYSGLSVSDLDQAHKTLYYSFIEQEPLETLIQACEHYDVVPNSIRLATGEAQLIADPQSGPGMLRSLLEPVRERYDYVLIDSPPNVSLLSVNGLAAADQVLIPVKTDFISLMGITQLLDTIEKTRRRNNPRLSILGILPTMFNSRYTHDQEALEQLVALSGSGVQVFDPINRSTSFDQAAAEYRTTSETDPTSLGAQAYFKLAEDIIRLTKPTV